MVSVIFPVTDLISSKRYISNHTVEKAVWIICFFKSLYRNPVFLIKLLCNLSRNRIKLYSIHICMIHTLWQESHEISHSTRWFQNISLSQSHISKCFIHCLNYCRRCVKSIQCRCPCSIVFIRSQYSF